jgi:hypothetical protein
MNVTQFFHELGIATYIVVVISLLPEMFGIADQPPGYALLQRLHRFGQSLSLRFVDQKMNVLGHDNISINAKPEASPYTFQRYFEDSAAFCGSEQEAAVIAAESYKVTLSGVMKTLESGRHAHVAYSCFVPHTSEPHACVGHPPRRLSARRVGRPPFKRLQDIFCRGKTCCSAACYTGSGS